MIRTALKRNPRKTRVVRSKALPAPTEGWDASSALANMDQSRAVRLLNWFPQPGYVEIRRGYQEHAGDIGSAPKVVSSVDDATDILTSAGHGLANADPVRLHSTSALPGGLTALTTYYVRDVTTDTFKLAATAGGSAIDLSTAGSGTITLYEITAPAVETLAVWQGPSSSKLFAAAGGAIWDITSEQDGTFSYISGTEDRWQWCNHTTSGGSFLFMVNGTDAPIHYNGTTWAAPAITGITEEEAIGVISHKKRLWFVMKNSTKGAYLGTEAVAGAASVFEFGSLFTKGGYLQALATWTRDGGSGADDYFVAISSRGQVAVYQGTDPSSANTWALVGVFDVPTPIGRRCFTRLGGDVVLITVEGVFPLSQLLSVDNSQARRVAISERISQAFNDAARAYRNNWGWEAVVYAKGTRLIVNIPTDENATAKQYVMNTLTGAWCEFNSHDANTWVIYNDNLYFAGSAGIVYRADQGASDLTDPIVAVGECAYNSFGSPQLKRFTMLKPFLTATNSNRPSVGISVDFVETEYLSQLGGRVESTVALWDVSLWDVAMFGASDVPVNEWAAAAALGTFGSVKFQAQTIVSNGAEDDDGEVMRMQGFLVLYEPGEFL